MKKSTQELLEAMKMSSNYWDYLSSNRESIGQGRMKIDRALASVLAEKNLKKADVIARSGLEPHYAYQIFSGIKNPARDKVIMLCFGAGLNPEEAQSLLRITGYTALYGKEERDNAILFGLTKNLSILEVNDLLYELNCPLLV